MALGIKKTFADAVSMHPELLETDRIRRLQEYYDLPLGN